MSAGKRVVAAARGCIGVRFRAQGRDPAFGLDCVGLVAVAVRAGGFGGVVPDGYALRSGDAGTVCATIDAAGLVRVAVPLPGDVLLFGSGAGQLHLAIGTGDGIVHADAMLRRVVERPGAPPWPLVQAWRVFENSRKGEFCGGATLRSLSTDASHRRNLRLLRPLPRPATHTVS